MGATLMFIVDIKPGFPPLQRGIKGDFVFKSLPASLCKGRREGLDESGSYYRDYGLRD